jgi:hypothetical protein
MTRADRNHRARADLERDRLVERIALHITQRVLALIGLEINRALNDFANL